MTMKKDSQGVRSSEQVAVPPDGVALARGHTQRGLFTSACVDLMLAFAPGADLDSTFTATDLESGERIAVNGWGFDHEEA